MTKNHEYKKHIVSTPEHAVFLHRTSKDLAEKIMKYGLKSGPDLKSTASFQPEDLDEAEDSYNQTHKGNDAVIVLKIPMELYNKAREGFKGEEVLHDDIGYFNTEEGLAGLYVHPEHVHGWIDKKTNEYTPNPYREEGFKHLSIKKPSDLEKEVLAGIKEKKPEKEKTPKTKKPKVPKDLVIVD